MLVGTGIVTIMFAAAVVGWRWFGGGESGTERERAGWGSVALVDRSTGDVTYVDADGEMIGESLDHGRTGSLYAGDGVLALANSRTLTVLAERGNDAEPVVVDLPSPADIATVRTDGPTFLAAGTATGGDVSLVDLTTRSVIDIGDLALGSSPIDPKMFLATLRTNSDGSMFGIADAANFQTIVVRPDGDEPVFLADQPIAIGEDLVATSQTVGLQADVSLVALDRTTKATVPTDIPAGSTGVLHDDRLTMVAVGGEVYRIEAGADTAERLGTVAVPAGAAIEWVAPTAGGERLAVGGATFVAVVDLDGRTLFTTTFSTAIDPTPPEWSWRCLPVGGPGGHHSVIDLDSGEQLADLADLDDVVGVSADGCRVLGAGSAGAVLIDPSGTAPIGEYDRIVLGPDGASIVRVLGGEIDLLLLDDDLEVGEPISLSELGEADDLIAFVPE